MNIGHFSDLRLGPLKGILKNILFKYSPFHLMVDMKTVLKQKKTLNSHQYP